MLIGIFGTGRNGSSLITYLLDGLGETYVHPVEEKFLTGFDCVSQNKKISRLINQNCIDYPLNHINKNVDTSLLNFMQPSINMFNKHCEETVGDVSKIQIKNIHSILNKKNYSAKNFVSDYLIEISNKAIPNNNFKNYLFKSIETPYIKDYQLLFPNMKFIHIVRNPYDIFSSQKRSLIENKSLPASYLGSDWLVSMIRYRWDPHMNFIKKIQDNSNHIIIKYEDLTANPENEVTRISKFLNVSPPKRPKAQTIFNDRDKINWGGNPSKKGIKMPNTVVKNLQIKSNYEEILSKREVDLISYALNDSIKFLDYELKSNKSKKQVFLSYLKVDKWEFINCNSPIRLLKGIFGFFLRRIFIFRL